MNINIKNEETVVLAHRLAEMTGTTVTEAVTAALRETLDRKCRQRDPDVLLPEVAEIQTFLAGLPDGNPESPGGVLGYDEYGLRA